MSSKPHSPWRMRAFAVLAFIGIFILSFPAFFWLALKTAHDGSDVPSNLTLVVTLTGSTICGILAARTMQRRYAAPKHH